MCFHSYLDLSSKQGWCSFLLPQPPFFLLSHVCLISNLQTSFFFINCLDEFPSPPQFLSLPSLPLPTPTCALMTTSLLIRRQTLLFTWQWIVSSGGSNAIPSSSTPCWTDHVQGASAAIVIGLLLPASYREYCQLCSLGASSQARRPWNGHSSALCCMYGTSILCIVIQCKMLFGHLSAAH